jgi:hypothetical protein
MLLSQSLLFSLLKKMSIIYFIFCTLIIQKNHKIMRGQINPRHYIISYTKIILSLNIELNYLIYEKRNCFNINNSTLGIQLSRPEAIALVSHCCVKLKYQYICVIIITIKSKKYIFIFCIW